MKFCLKDPRFLFKGVQQFSDFSGMKRIQKLKLVW